MCYIFEKHEVQGYQYDIPVCHFTFHIQMALSFNCSPNPGQFNEASRGPMDAIFHTVIYTVVLKVSSMYGMDERRRITVYALKHLPAS